MYIFKNTTENYYRKKGTLTAIAFVGEPQISLFPTRCRVQLALRRVRLPVAPAYHVWFLPPTNIEQIHDKPWPNYRWKYNPNAKVRKKKLKLYESQWITPDISCRCIFFLLQRFLIIYQKTLTKKNQSVIFATTLIFVM